MSKCFVQKLFLKNLVKKHRYATFILVRCIHIVIYLQNVWKCKNNSQACWSFFLQESKSEDIALSSEQAFLPQTPSLLSSILFMFLFMLQELCIWGKTQKRFGYLEFFSNV